jgi:hypothetical protein
MNTKRDSIFNRWVRGLLEPLSKIPWAAVRCNERQLRLRVLGIVLLGVCAIGYSAQARAELPTVATFDPMTKDEIDRFRDSLKNNVPLNFVSPKKSQTIETHLAGVWAGSKTTVSTQVGDITLRFRPNMDELLSRSTTTEDQSKALLNTFDLTFSLFELTRELTFIHSDAEIAKEAKGFKARIGKEDGITLSRLVRGQRESGLYLAIPPVRNLEEGWGVFVCPRVVRYKTVGHTGTRAIYLEKSPYDLSEVMFPLEASARTSFESSRGNVRAFIQMQPSSDMPETEVVKDEMISTAADPKLLYRPNRPFDFYRIAPLLDVQQGLNVVVELQNAAGFLRRQNFSHVVSVHRSNEPSPVSVKTSEGRAAGDAGDCYILQVQKYVWTEYDKTSVSF